MTQTLLAAAIALLCQASPADCPTAQSTAVRPMPGSISRLLANDAFGAYSYTDRTIYVIGPATRNPQLDDSAELALVLSHEIKHAEQQKRGDAYTATTCLGMEQEAFAAQGAFYGWLFNDNPGNVGYNSAEDAAISVLHNGLASEAAWDCSRLQSPKGR